MAPLALVVFAGVTIISAGRLFFAGEGVRLFMPVRALMEGDVRPRRVDKLLRRLRCSFEVFGELDQGPFLDCGLS